MKLIFDLNLIRISNFKFLTDNSKGGNLRKGYVFVASGDWAQNPEVFVEKQVILYRRARG